MRRKSKTTKKRLKMGTGTGANYKPYIQVGEFGSLGTASKIIDWKHGRTVHLLSQGEVEAYFLLRWEDDVLDIREQFPLEEDITLQLAEEFGIKHPSHKGKPVTMTTDLLVTKADGDHAYTVKTSLDEIKVNQRTTEKLYIEKMYWKLKNVDYTIITKEQIDHQKAINIRDVVAHYNNMHYTDDISLLKQLIAHKKIIVDMSKPIDYEALVQTEEFKKWKTQ